MADRYVKGTQHTVLRQDQNGQPLEAVERDPDGQLWHVKSDGSEPTRIRDDEVSSLVTETSQRHDDRR